MSDNRLIWSCYGWKISVQPAYLIFVCCAISLCIFLSYWQWQRAQAADLRYQTYQQQGLYLATDLSDSPQDYQKVKISGEIKQHFFLDNQIYRGVAGWHIVAEVQTAQALLLVDLGWQPKYNQLVLHAELPDYIEVQGVLKKPQPGFMLQAAMDDPNWPQIIQQIHIQLLNDYYGYDLSPFVLYAETQVADLIPAPIIMDNKFYMHLGYTIQWLLIAIACFLGFIYISRQEQQQNDEE